MSIHLDSLQQVLHWVFLRAVDIVLTTCRPLLFSTTRVHASASARLLDAFRNCESQRQADLLIGTTKTVNSYCLQLGAIGGHVGWKVENASPHASRT